MSHQSQGMIICAFVLVAASLVTASTDIDAWNEFKNKFEKNYSSPAEEDHRFKIFVENKRNIDSFNTRSANPTTFSFVQEINALSDLTTDELNLSRNGFKPSLSRRETKHFERVLETLLVALNETSGEVSDVGGPNDRAWYDRLAGPKELDYRSSNKVSKVKNQGSCGSCWAFAVTGALESILSSHSNNTLLSEQNLVDCSRSYGNAGCSGGLMDQAFDYVKDNGIMSSNDYPYTASDDVCRFNKSKSVMQVKGSLVLPRGNELLLRLALVLTGPLPIAIDASRSTFHSYKSGIYNDRACQSNNINHAMLLVGYGSDSKFGDYWIVKNSWGRNWGEDGYMRIARNLRNLCGIASYAVLPIP